jgi:hypothetical protein
VRKDVTNKAFTQNVMYTETYSLYLITADDILVDPSAKMTQGNTLPATEE